MGWEDSFQPITTDPSSQGWESSFVPVNPNQTSQSGTADQQHAAMLANSTAAMSGNGSALSGVPAQLLGYVAGREKVIPGMHEVGSAIAAALGSGQGNSFSDRYANLEQSQQAMREAADKTQPRMETPSWMPDITPGGIGDAGTALATAPFMPGPKAIPKSLWQAGKQAAGFGSLYGGIYGAADNNDAFQSTDDNIKSRLFGAAMGVPMGAVIGLPFGAMGYGIGNMATKRTANVPDDIKILSDYMGMDNNGPSNIRNILDNNKGIPLTIADAAGPNVQSLVEGRAQSPGSAMSQAVDMLQNRNMSQPSRIDDLISNTIGSPDYFSQRDQQLGELGGQKVQDAYQQAYANGSRINDDQINGLVSRLGDTSVGSRILKNAEDTARLAGNTLGPVDANGIRTGFSSYGLDTIKQSADQIIRSSSAQGNFDKYTTQGKNLIDVVNQITHRHDALNPLYAKARGTYSNPASLVNALDLGYSDLWGQNSHQAVNTFNNLSDPEQQAALSGMARRISETLKTQAGDKAVSGAANTPKSFLDNPRNIEILQKVMPSDKYDQLINGLKQESNMQTFGNKVLSNSSTARRLAAQEDFQNRTTSSAESKVVPAANYFANLTLDKPGSWFGITPNKVENWAQGVSEANRDKIGNSIAQRMLSTHPIQNQQTLSALDNYAFNKQMQDYMRKRAFGFGNGLLTTGVPRFSAPFSLAPPVNNQR